MAYGIHCCKNCTTRHENCHSTCDLYRNERREYEKMKERIDFERSLDRMDRRYWNAKYKPTSANMGGKIP